MTSHLPVTEMFRELIQQGHITPKEELMEDLRFPGELPYTPAIATYGTSNVPLYVGVETVAELGQRS